MEPSCCMYRADYLICICWLFLFFFGCGGRGSGGGGFKGEASFESRGRYSGV